MVEDQGSSSNNSQHFWNLYSVPKTMPKAILICPFLVITTTLWGRNYHYLPFRDEKAETQRNCPLSKASELADSRIGVLTQLFLMQSVLACR